MSDEKKIYEVAFGTWVSIPLYVLADDENRAIEAAKKTFEWGRTTPVESDFDWLNRWEEYEQIEVTDEYPADTDKPMLLFDADEFLGVKK